MCMKPSQCEIPLKASITDTQIRGTSLSGERSNLFTLILGFRGQKSAPALNCVTLESYHSSGRHNRCASNGARLLKFTQRPGSTPITKYVQKLTTQSSLSRNIQNGLADVKTHCRERPSEKDGEIMPRCREERLKMDCLRCKSKGAGLLDTFIASIWCSALSNSAKFSAPTCSRSQYQHVPSIMSRFCSQIMADIPARLNLLNNSPN